TSTISTSFGSLTTTALIICATSCPSPFGVWRCCIEFRLHRRKSLAHRDLSGKDHRRRRSEASALEYWGVPLPCVPTRRRRNGSESRRGSGSPDPEASARSRRLQVYR